MTLGLIATDATSAVAWHTALEMAAVFAGMRLFARNMRGHPVGGIAAGHGFVVALGGIVAAIAGSKMAVWLDRPDVFLETLGSLRMLAMGQSIVGALIGGLVGVELAKASVGVRRSTGDAFVLPLALGIAIGRVGCFVAGLYDDTYGIATSLPWGIDFGDGVARHPTQLYDIAFVGLLAALLHAQRVRLARVPGLAFKLFFCAYLGWRVAIDGLKPVPFPYVWGMSGLQLLALVALIAYLPLLLRDARKLGARTAGARTVEAGRVA